MTRQGANRLKGGAAVLALLAMSAAAVTAANFRDWGDPVNAESLPGSGDMVNTVAGDGCPNLDPYTNDLYIASARDGTLGGLDIWRAKWNGESWDDPVNLGAPINTEDDEFCPSASRGNKLFFVRRPAGDPDGDIYLSRTNRGQYSEPQRLSDPINSSAQEWSPSYYEEEGGVPVLYFSSTRGGSQDIWVSRNWAPPVPVEELNTDADDARPNVRRDGLEIVFDTNRDGGPPDIWTSTRNSYSAEWSEPVPIEQVNSPAGESRASISWDGKTLVFGSSRSGGEGAADVYVSRRDRATGRR